MLSKSSKAAADGDHKAPSDLETGKMQPVGVDDVVAARQRFASGTGIPREDIAKASALGQYPSRFRNDKEDRRDDPVGLNDTAQSWRPDRTGVVYPYAGNPSSSTSWRSWYSGNSNERAREEQEGRPARALADDRRNASMSALAEERHRSASAGTFAEHPRRSPPPRPWQYQRPPTQVYPPTSTQPTWHWPRRTSPAAAPSYPHRHYPTPPSQERPRSLLSEEKTVTAMAVSAEHSAKFSFAQGRGARTSAENNVNQSETAKRPPSSLFEATTKKPKGFDKLDLLCSATLEIGPLQANPTGCSCPKSRCIALYCDCFKAGRRCDPTMCSCLGCKNTIDESGETGARTKAIRSILARNPRAFVTAGIGNPISKLPPGEVACNCVRSRCLKLYCSCFQSGKVCNEKVCSCVSCLNTEEDSEGHRHFAIQQCLEKRPDAFRTRIKVAGLGCACKNNRCIRKYCECFRNELGCTDKCSCRDCENDHNRAAV